LNNTDINLDILMKKANEIKMAIEDIKGYTSNNLEKFLDEPSLIDATKYKFLIVMEGCISICNHIAVRLGKKVPESYSDCFKIVLELGVISEPLSKKLMKMAKFRNLLTHLYWEVDDKKVYEISKQNLGDIVEFLEEIGSYLKEKE